MGTYAVPTPPWRPLPERSRFPLARAAKVASRPSLDLHRARMWYSRARAREDKITLAVHKITLAVQDRPGSAADEPLVPRNSDALRSVTSHPGGDDKMTRRTGPPCPTAGRPESGATRSLFAGSRRESAQLGGSA